ncbi:RNA-guided endonuclease InsQ/TnpB family protein [Massilia sp. S19_KUP03_FR1]|uniref:RNA-guided endonuclease InsQ/TnpB family protein n=1 Tax=Massilia sp. S19_KUP03_FR1 TaxID=3025503 RepID=UPI002FCDD769
MQLAHRIRLDPNNVQATGLSKAAGVARFAYNWALAQWQRQYDLSKTDAALPKPSEAALRRQLNAIKRSTFPWMLEVTKNAPQMAIIQLGRAFENFFKWISRYPTFRRKGRDDRFTITNDQFYVEKKRIRIPKLGRVRMRESLRYAGHLVSATVSRHAGHWYASITVDTPDDPPLPQAENQGVAGVDLGITALATLSNGEKVVGPNALKTLLNKMRRLARSLSRKVKGSQNRDKAKMKLAKLHAKIADMRRDCLHKLTKDITRRFHTIVIEDLVRIAGIALRLQAQVAAQARRTRLETPATPAHLQDCSPRWHADRCRSLVCEQRAVFKLRIQAGVARSGIEAMGLLCFRCAP